MMFMKKLYALWSQKEKMSEFPFGMKEFTVIYKILSALRDSMDEDDFDLNTIDPKKLDISETRWLFLIQMLSDEGYVKDLTVNIKNDRTMILLLGIRPRITLKGLEYLADNTMMKKAWRFVKEIKDTVPGI